jgi:hypothetical protein
MARRKHDETTIRLHLDGQVALRRLEEALDAWNDLLREVATDVVGATGRDAVRFVVTGAKAGSFDLTARPQPAKRAVPVAVMPRIAKTITSGLRTLERRATRPKHFNDTALLKVRDLGKLTSPETPAVKISNGTADPIALSSRLIANVEAVLAPEVTSIGGVEGKLEGLIIHGKSRFLIFDPLTGRQVTCYFSERIPYDDVLRAFGRRVAVTGVIRSRRSGERVDIQATRLQVMQPDEELPSAADVLGILRAAP